MKFWHPAHPRRDRLVLRPSSPPRLPSGRALRPAQAGRARRRLPRPRCPPPRPRRPPPHRAPRPSRPRRRRPPTQAPPATARTDGRPATDAPLGTATVTVTFSGWDAAAGAAVVGGYVDALESTGTCAVTDDARQQRRHPQRAPRPDATTMSCGELSVPRARCHAGRLAGRPVLLVHDPRGLGARRHHRGPVMSRAPVRRRTAALLATVAVVVAQVVHRRGRSARRARHGRRPQQVRPGLHHQRPDLLRLAAR